MQREQPQQSVDSLRRTLFRQFAQLADHRQILEPGEMRVQVGLFGNIAHPSFVSRRVFLNRHSAEENLAQAGFDQSGDDLHGGGLTRAVRPQIAGHFSGSRREADVFHGCDAGEVFRDVAKFQHDGVRYYVEFYLLSSKSQVEFYIV